MARAGQRLSTEQHNRALGLVRAARADSPGLSQRALVALLADAGITVSQPAVGKMLAKLGPAPPPTNGAARPAPKAKAPRPVAPLPDDTPAAARQLVSEFRAVAADPNAPAAVRSTAMELAADLMARLLDLHEDGQGGAA